VSPDGRTIVFDSNRGGFQSAIWTIPASGGAPKRLTAPELAAFGPDWSPDGRSIVFTIACCTPFSQVWVMGRNGGHAHALTDVPSPAQAAFARYSPDGSRIVLESELGSPDGCCPEIFTMNADGTDLQAVTSGGDLLAFFPAWGPGASA
jgi:Tol biopolymer transport system component